MKNFKKKLTAFSLAGIMALSGAITTPVHTYAASSYERVSVTSSTQKEAGIYLHMTDITNDAHHKLYLPNIEIRYYFSADGYAPYGPEIYKPSLLFVYNYTTSNGKNIKDYTTVEVHKLKHPVSNADYYVSVKFKSNLPADVVNCLNKKEVALNIVGLQPTMYNPGLEFNLTNDLSYRSSNGVNHNISVYSSNQLIFGNYNLD